MTLPEPARETRDAATLAAVAGTYESPGNRIDITVEDGELVLRAVSKVALAKEFERKPPPMPPARLAFCGEDRIIVLEGPTRNTQGELLRDSGGAIAWLRIGGRIHRRL